MTQHACHNLIDLMIFSNIFNTSIINHICMQYSQLMNNWVIRSFVLHVSIMMRYMGYRRLFYIFHCLILLRIRNSVHLLHLGLFVRRRFFNDPRFILIRNFQFILWKSVLNRFEHLFYLHRMSIIIFDIELHCFYFYI